MMSKGAWLLLSLQGKEWEVCEECQLPYEWADIHGHGRWGEYYCRWHWQRHRQ
jgi:hypothetical protein